MVVPGFLETKRASEANGGMKSGCRSPLEYFVEKMGADNVRIGLLRLVAASAWAAFLYLPLYSEYSVAQLRQVLMLHHTMAAAGLDEAILMSWTAQEPFMLRLLRPGSTVAPFLRDFLPQKQSLIGAGCYAGFLVLGVFQVVTRRVSDLDVLLFVVVFLVSTLFDRGAFHSTRPSDIFKFLVATLFPGPERNVIVLLGCLYFWSGLVKVRGFFHNFVFPYQFLNFSGISWYARRWLFNADYVPFRIISAFGFLGTVLEMLAGLCMLAAPARVAMYGMALGCAMHVFIFFCGMGPFRWNIMTLYMLVCCMIFQQEDPALSLWRPDPVHTIPMVYLAIFGFAIPIIGLVQPITLGRYFGGYRMATFHFAGNDAYRALLIRRNVIPTAPPEGIRDTSVYGSLLRLRADSCSRLTQDEDLWTGVLYADGADIEGSLRRGFEAPSGMTSFDEFDRSYVYVPVTWLNMRGPLLNTKWDEYLPVTDRIVDLCCETVGQPHAEGDIRLQPNTVLLHTQHAVPWAFGRRKRAELSDISGSAWSQARFVEEVELPWLRGELEQLAGVQDSHLKALLAGTN